MFRSRKSVLVICIAFMFFLLVPGVIIAEGQREGAEKGKVTLRFAINHGVEDEKLFEEVITNFQDANPNVKVELSNTSGAQYYDKLATMMASDTVPDVFYIRGGSGDQKLYDKGIAVSIDSFVQRDREEINVDDFIEAQIAELKFKGEWMALPYDYSTLGVYYNKDLFDEAGLSYPTDDWDWDQAISYAKKLTKRNADGTVTQWGFANLPIQEDFSANFMTGSIWTMGGKFFNEDYTEVYMDSPETIEAFRYMSSIAKEHKAAPGAGATGMEEPFFTGRAAMSFNGSWATMQHRRNCNFAFDVTMMPKNPNNGNRVVAATGGNWAIGKDTEYVDESWEFTKHLASVESERILIVEPIRSLPARKSLHEEWSQNIAEGKLPPQNAAIFSDQVVEYGKNVPPIYFDWKTPNRNLLPLTLNEDYSVEEVLKDCANQIRSSMREVGIDVSD